MIGILGTHFPRTVLLKDILNQNTRTKETVMSSKYITSPNRKCLCHKGFVSLFLFSSLSNLNNSTNPNLYQLHETSKIFALSLHIRNAKTKPWSNHISNPWVVLLETGLANDQLWASLQKYTRNVLVNMDTNYLEEQTTLPMGNKWRPHMSENALVTMGTDAVTFQLQLCRLQSPVDHYLFLHINPQMNSSSYERSQTNKGHN